MFCFGTHFLHFWQIFQNKMSYFFNNSSNKIFHFILSNVFETYQVYYTILFITFEFIFTVSLKHIFCLPKKPEWLFFSWLDYKSLLNKFSVLINYSVLCGLPIIFMHPAVSLLFHDPGFSGFMSRVWVQALEEAAYMNILGASYTNIFIPRWNSTMACKQQFDWIIKMWCDLIAQKINYLNLNIFKE